MFRLSQYFVKQEEAVAPEAGGAVGGEPTAAPAEPVAEPTPEATPEPETKAEEEPKEEPQQKIETGEGYEDSFFGHAAEMFDSHDLNGQLVVDFFQDNGKFSDEHIKVMEEKMGKAQTSILLQGIENELKASAARQEAEDQAVFDSVGGEENYNAAVDWINSEESGWTQEEKDDMDKLLQMGGNISQWAAQLMWIGYTNAGQPEKAVTTEPKIRDGQKAAISHAEPISIQDYNKGIKAAKSQAEVDELVKRANWTRASPQALDLGWKFG
jgi:hypothetical protein